MTEQSTALERAAPVQLARAQEWTADQVDLIKRTIAQGATDDELKLFLYTAKRMGLDPLANQIHAVKRWDRGQEKMAIQVGIDGLRLVADRTGKYAPGRPTEFVYGKGGQVVSATAYVRKLVNGEWHEAGETAHYQEYVGRKKDGTPNRMWATKPHIMLAKCAEARALRRCFPAELSGVYTSEEMDQAGEPVGREAKQKDAQKKADIQTDNQWVKRLWFRAEKAGMDPNEWSRLAEQYQIRWSKPIAEDNRATFTAEVEAYIDNSRNDMPEDDPLPGSPEYVDNYTEENQPEDPVPGPMFASGETMDQLWKALKVSGIAQTESEMVTQAKFHLKLEQLDSLENLTEDEAQRLIGIADKWSQGKSRQHSMHNGTGNEAGNGRGM